MKTVIKLNNPVKMIIQEGEIFGSYIQWFDPCEAIIRYQENVNVANESGYKIDNGHGYAGFDPETCIFHRYSDGSCQEHCFRVVEFLK